MHVTKYSHGPYIHLTKVILCIASPGGAGRGPQPPWGVGPGGAAAVLGGGKESRVGQWAQWCWAVYEMGWWAVWEVRARWVDRSVGSVT